MSFLETLFEGLESGMDGFQLRATDLLSMIRRSLDMKLPKSKCFPE